MAARTIETKAVISAEDRTGPAFAAVVQHMARMEDAAKHAAARVKVAAAAEGQTSTIAREQRRVLAAEDRRLRVEQRLSRQEEVAHLREVEHLNREISRHGVARFAAEGAANAIAAHSIYDSILETIKAGAAYQHEVTALRNSGRTQAELGQMDRASRDTVAAIPTSTYTENLRVINETTSAFGSLNHAIENLPFMQKSAAALQAALPPGQTIDAADLGNKMARVFEERGTAMNPELFRKEASEAMRAMVFSGGKFNPAEFLNFAQQAKSSLQNYDLRFLSRIAPSLIGTQGGERAGTAANAFTSLIMGKANDAKQAEEWARYGLLDTSQAIMKKGKIVSWRAGAVKDTDLALRDPLEWAEKTLLPALAAKGVKVDDRLELAKVLGTMARNQNANLFMNETAQAQQRARLHKDEGMINQAGSLDDIYARDLKDDPTQAIKGLSASLDNLMTTVSGPAMKTAASGLTAFATGIQAVSNVLKQHPIAALTGGAAVATGALAGSGYMAYKLLDGFGLGTSATALDGSAAALTAAAAKLGAAGAVTGGEAAADKYLAGGTGAAAAAEVATAGKPGIVGGLFKSMARLVPQYLGYELGKQGIAYGLDRLPHPAYPRGYDPDAKLNEGPIDRIKDIWRETEGARAWLKASLVQGANAKEMPRRTSASPYGALVPLTPAPMPPRPLAVAQAPMPSRPLAVAQAPALTPRAPAGTLDTKAQPPRDTKIESTVTVTVTPPPPLKVSVEVEASSTLLQIVDKLKTLSAQLSAQAKAQSHTDNGPGGLGETHTGQ